MLTLRKEIAEILAKEPLDMREISKIFQAAGNSRKVNRVCRLQKIAKTKPQGRTKIEPKPGIRWNGNRISSLRSEGYFESAKTNPSPSSRVRRTQSGPPQAGSLGKFAWRISHFTSNRENEPKALRNERPQRRAGGHDSGNRRRMRARSSAGLNGLVM